MTIATLKPNPVNHYFKAFNKSLLNGIMQRPYTKPNKFKWNPKPSFIDVADENFFRPESEMNVEY